MILLELLNMVTRLWHAYERMLQTHPIITKIAVASPMFALTDVAVQTIEQRRDKDLSREGKRGSNETTLDLRRTATQALFGVYYATVHAHFIWGRLEVLFGGVTFLTPFAGALSRVCIDQFITGTPLFNTVFFYTTGRLAQGMSHEDAMQNVSQRLWPMLCAHWSFWVPFHTLNFWLVPFRHRIVPAQIALFGWSAFMSYTGAKKQHPAATIE
jgi:hypothetical protein